MIGCRVFVSWGLGFQGLLSLFAKCCALHFFSGLVGAPRARLGLAIHGPDHSQALKALDRRFRGGGVVMVYVQLDEHSLHKGMLLFHGSWLRS